MTIWNKITKWLAGETDRKSFLYANYIDMANAQSMGNTFQSYAIDGYMSNPDVFACIREISTAIRGIDLCVYKQTADGLERLPEHPLLSLLNAPNAHESGSTFRERLISYHLIGGRAYIMRVGANDTRRPPQALYLLRPDSVNAIAGTRFDEPILRYQYNSATGTIDLPTELVLDLPVFNPVDAIGALSPMMPTATSVDSGVLGRRWNKNLINNSARPPGAFSTETSLTDPQYERLKQDIEAKYAGAENAGRPLLLEGGLKWQSLSLSPAEMDWLNGLRLSTVDICRVYNVPPELIGDSANKTYSNYQEARIAFYQETVLPLLDMLCEELTRWLVPLYGGGLILKYNADDIEALQENRDQIYTRIKDAWWLTPNERRQECGFAPSDNAKLDAFYIPQNLIPIELAGMAGMMNVNIPDDNSKSFSIKSAESELSDKVRLALDRVRNDAIKELTQ